MSTTKQFPEGIRVFQPFPDAPTWVIGNILIDKKQLVDWISKQPGQNVRLDILKSKKGSWYTSISDFEPNKGGGVITPNLSTNSTTLPPNANVVFTDTTDDLPF